MLKKNLPKMDDRILLTLDDYYSIFPDFQPIMLVFVFSRYGLC